MPNIYFLCLPLNFIKFLPLQASKHTTGNILWDNHKWHICIHGKIYPFIFFRDKYRLNHVASEMSRRKDVVVNPISFSLSRKRLWSFLKEYKYNRILKIIFFINTNTGWGLAQAFHQNHPNRLHSVKK